jgi:putative nucleotidyltransferase with HDIG domain
MPETGRLASRDEAWDLLCEYTEKEGLRKHALAVEAAMRYYAKLWNEDEELWGLTGLLHDFDYERWPTAEDHPARGVEILTAQGWPAALVQAVRSHAFPAAAPRAALLEKAILAADELTGFVGACALVRPSRSVADLPAESVIKKMKDKAFARSVDREYIRRGAEELGVPLPELVTLVIAAQRPIAERLGIAGVAAPELADAPVPDLPPDA